MTHGEISQHVRQTCRQQISKIQENLLYFFANQKRLMRRQRYTYAPRDVWSNSVTSVETPGQRQLLASNAYLNSSSQTTNSININQKMQINQIKTIHSLVSRDTHKKQHFDSYKPLVKIICTIGAWMMTVAAFTVADK